MLKNKINNNFYTGATNNLKQRIEQHSKGLVVSTKHLRPLQLVYFEACLNKADAYRREKYLKTGMGKHYIKNRIEGGLTG
ncbi:MAG: GIY-YIG nuclease family protein [Candidatus Omnitrophota bacterium]